MSFLSFSNFTKISKLSLWLSAIATAVLFISTPRTAHGVSGFGPNIDYNYLFHWGDKESNDELLSTLDQQGRLTDKSVEFLNSVYKTKRNFVAGQGLYLSINLFDSQGFGDFLLVLKIGPAFIPAENIKSKNDAATTKKARDQLPLISRYTETWHVMPRAYRPGDPEFSISTNHLRSFLDEYVTMLKSLNTDVRINQIIQIFYGLAATNSEKSAKGSDKQFVFRYFTKYLSTIDLLPVSEQANLLQIILDLEPHPSTLKVLELFKKTICQGSWTGSFACRDLKKFIDTKIAQKLTITPISQYLAFAHFACEKKYISKAFCDELKSQYRKMFESGNAAFATDTLRVYFDAQDFSIDLNKYFDIEKLLDSNCKEAGQISNCMELYIMQLYIHKERLPFKTLDRILTDILRYAKGWTLTSIGVANVLMAIEAQLLGRQTSEVDQLHKKFDETFARLFAQKYTDFVPDELLWSTLNFSEQFRSAALTEIFSDSKRSNNLLFHFNYENSDFEIRNKLKKLVQSYLTEKTSECETKECLLNNHVVVGVRDFVIDLIQKADDVKIVAQVTKTIATSPHLRLLFLSSIALFPESRFRDPNGRHLAFEAVFKELSSGLGFKPSSTPENSIAELLNLNRNRNFKKAVSPSKNCEASF